MIDRRCKWSGYLLGVFFVANCSHAIDIPFHEGGFALLSFLHMCSLLSHVAVHVLSISHCSVCLSLSQPYTQQHAVRNNPRADTCYVCHLHYSNGFTGFRHIIYKDSCCSNVSVLFNIPLSRESVFGAIVTTLVYFYLNPVCSRFVYLLIFVRVRAQLYFCKGVTCTLFGKSILIYLLQNLCYTYCAK